MAATRYAHCSAAKSARRTTRLRPGLIVKLRSWGLPTLVEQLRVERASNWTIAQIEAEITTACQWLLSRRISFRLLQPEHWQEPT